MEKIGNRVGRFICRNKMATGAAALILIGLFTAGIAKTWQAHRIAKAKERRVTEVRPVDHSGPVDYRDAPNYLLDARARERLMKDALTPDLRPDRADLQNVGLAMEPQADMANYRKTSDQEKSVADNRTDRAQPRGVSVSYALPAGVSIVTSADIDAANQTNPEYLARIKKTEAALDIFRERLAASEKLVVSDPGNVQVQGDLAYSSSRIGDLLVELGDQSGAVPFYQRAVDIYTRSAATGQEDLAVSLKLAQVLGKLAQTHAKLGHIEKARAECNKAADLLQAIPDDANNLEQRHLRAFAYIAVADAYTLLAKDARTPQRLLKESWRLAREMYQRSLDILTDLRDRGVLDADDVAQIDVLTQKIAECDLFLNK